MKFLNKLAIFMLGIMIISAIYTIMVAVTQKEEPWWLYLTSGLYGFIKMSDDGKQQG